jgi:DNA repair protein RecN (Recombination protein N)
MLVSLSIKNYALIAALSIDFSSGFTTITGETGAGKSILLGALGLVLGKRADISSLKEKDQKCIIEAHFDIKGYNLELFFENTGLDYEPLTIIRREILPTGKSRAFVNDSPVNLSDLQDLGNYLIDIHSQHQTLELTEDHFQFQILDQMANHQELLALYGEELRQYKNYLSQKESLTNALNQLRKEQEYNAFVYEELEKAQLLPDEQETLESQFEALNNVALITESLTKAQQHISEEQFGARAQLLMAKHGIQKIASFSKAYAAFEDRLNSLAIEIDDLLLEMENQFEKIETNPNALEQIQSRLQLIYDLQKKHHVQSIEELIQIKNAVGQKVSGVLDLEANLEANDRLLKDTRDILEGLAAKLNKQRRAVIPKLLEQLKQILTQLGMPNATFDVQLIAKDQFFAHGKDQVQLLFSANKGGNLESLKKTASGGEMSRIMLAIKSILANYSKLPTIIFDEIDTGVSGDISDKMGSIMKDMSAHMQVFSITHLPQIAAKGDYHYKVYKSTIAETTETAIKLLDQESRIQEIAQMLSGAKITDSALNHAKSLLN